jgi:alpha-tubulin suppressor-like RCC1 family protein
MLNPLIRTVPLFLALASLACGEAEPTAPEPEPPVFGPPLAFRSIAAGNGGSTCGVTTDSAVYCWGINDAGQLGVGPALGGTASPRAISGGLAFDALGKGGYRFQCGVTAGSVPYCWGANGGGQLGDGTDVDQYVPVAVDIEVALVSVSASFEVACGLDPDGVAYCWGQNRWGEAGIGTTAPTEGPRPVGTDLRFAELSLGGSSIHTCGMTIGGTAYCWGDGWDLVPEAVPGGHVFRTLVGGGGHACALTEEGAAYCWGDNSYGQLGDGSTTSSPKIPVAVSGGLTFASITGGNTHTCALTDSGAAHCWGENVRGELGDGTAQIREEPVAVQGGLTFVSLSAGTAYTCGVAEEGAGYCWGVNVDWRLGVGLLSSQLTPTPVVGVQEGA